MTEIKSRMQLKVHKLLNVNVLQFPTRTALISTMFCVCVWGGEGWGGGGIGGKGDGGHSTKIRVVCFWKVLSLHQVCFLQRGVICRAEGHQQ